MSRVQSRFVSLKCLYTGLIYIQEFSREALIWRQLSHPNVLPFFGLYYLENRLCLVSPWMENGNMMEFLTNENPDLTDRLSLVSVLRRGNS
jgi:serine/threonine protein kinase